MMRLIRDDQVSSMPLEVASEKEFRVTYREGGYRTSK
jgi:hypothetical protein